MFRTAFVVFALLIAGFSDLAEAQEATKNAECRKIEQMALTIIEDRTSGTSAQRAERRVLRQTPDMSKADDVLALQLVAWIYSLPEAQVSAEISDMLYEACLTQ